MEIDAHTCDGLGCFTMMMMMMMISSLSVFFLHSFPFFWPCACEIERAREIEWASECMYWYSARTLWWPNMDIHLLICSRTPLSLSQTFRIGRSNSRFCENHIHLSTYVQFTSSCWLRACLLVGFFPKLRLVFSFLCQSFSYLHSYNVCSTQIKTERKRPSEWLSESERASGVLSSLCI